jgi:galactose mutarotase-like enzyme
VGLLASPPLDEAAALMTGKGADANGSVSLSMGGAFEIPWAGRVFGTPSGNGLNAAWQGRSIHLPAERSNSGNLAKGGLVLRAPFTSVKINAMPDGGEAEAVYEAGSFDGRWPSKLEITSTTQLSSRVLEMKVTARNTGDEPEPVGIGWQPRFAILNGNHGDLMLRLPSVTRVEVSSQHSGEPTGKLKTVAGTKYDFSGRSGAKLDGVTLDDTFVNLRQAPLDNGPVAELRDPSNGYGVRMTMLSPSIKALYVSAPAERRYVTISPRFNYDDPFGREWENEDTGMAILRPGQTAQWKIRLEIFAVPSVRY